MLECEYNSYYVMKGAENVNLKNIRLEKNMSQEQLAKEINVDRSTVTKWETGEAMPRANKLVKLSQIFNCSVDELLKEG